MRHHERRRHDLEAEHPLSCGLLDGGLGQRPQALALQVSRNPALHFGQIRPGAAAWVLDFDETERLLQPAGVEYLLEQRPQHRRA